jgi:hypothetical protein
VGRAARVRRDAVVWVVVRDSVGLSQEFQVGDELVDTVVVHVKRAHEPAAVDDGRVVGVVVAVHKVVVCGRGGERLRARARGRPRLVV